MYAKSLKSRVLYVQGAVEGWVERVTFRGPVWRLSQTTGCKLYQH